MNGRVVVNNVNWYEYPTVGLLDPVAECSRDSERYDELTVVEKMLCSHATLRPTWPGTSPRLYVDLISRLCVIFNIAFRVSWVDDSKLFPRDFRPRQFVFISSRRWKIYLPPEQVQFFTRYRSLSLTLNFFRVNVLKWLEVIGYFHRSCCISFKALAGWFSQNPLRRCQWPNLVLPWVKL